MIQKIKSVVCIIQFTLKISEGFFILNMHGCCKKSDCVTVCYMSAVVDSQLMVARFATLSFTAGPAYS